VKKLKITTTMADGRELESTTTLADYLLWEKTAKKQIGWSATITDNPTTWESFLGWASLKRTGQITCSYEQFVAGEAEMVDAAQIEADPTPEAATTD